MLVSVAIDPKCHIHGVYYQELSVCSTLFYTPSEINLMLLDVKAAQ